MSPVLKMGCFLQCSSSGRLWPSILLSGTTCAVPPRTPRTDRDILTSLLPTGNFSYSSHLFHSTVNNKSGLNQPRPLLSHLRRTTTMEDKYIGIILAMSGTLAIGTSFIITKKVRRVVGILRTWATLMYLPLLGICGYCCRVGIGDYICAGIE